VRDDLIQHRTLLQAKHDALESSGWGFGNLDRAPSLLDVELHQRLDEIEEQLRDVGGDDRYLDKNLEILIDVLSQAEHQLWAQPLTLIVDRMGIRRNTPVDDAQELDLRELHNAAGRQLIARMVLIPAIPKL